MKIEKAVYLINLTRDKDFPSDTISSSIVDSYEENSVFNLIVRNKNENMETQYFQYAVRVDGEFIEILKQCENENDSIVYTFEVRNIIDRHFADLFVNSERTVRYEFNDDILNKDNVLDWKIVNSFEYDRVTKKSR